MFNHEKYYLIPDDELIQRARENRVKSKEWDKSKSITAANELFEYCQILEKTRPYLPFSYWERFAGYDRDIGMLELSSKDNPEDRKDLLMSFRDEIFRILRRKVDVDRIIEKSAKLNAHIPWDAWEFIRTSSIQIPRYMFVINMIECLHIRNDNWIKFKEGLEEKYDMDHSHFLDISLVNRCLCHCNTGTEDQDDYRNYHPQS